MKPLVWPWNESKMFILNKCSLCISSIENIEAEELFQDPLLVVYYTRVYGPILPN